MQDESGATIATIFGLVLVFFTIWGIGSFARAMWSIGRRKKPNDNPPTERQLAFIETLFEERRAEDLATKFPQTVDEASELIEKLKNRPHKRWASDVDVIENDDYRDEDRAS